MGPWRTIKKGKTQKHLIFLSSWAVLLAPHCEVRSRYLGSDSKMTPGPWLPLLSLHNFHPLQITKFTSWWGHFAKGIDLGAVPRQGHQAVCSVSYFIVDNKPCNIPFCSTEVYWVHACFKLYEGAWVHVICIHLVSVCAWKPTGMFPGVGIVLSARFLLETVVVLVCYCVTSALIEARLRGAT